MYSDATKISNFQISQLRKLHSEYILEGRPIDLHFVLAGESVETNSMECVLIFKSLEQV